MDPRVDDARKLALDLLWTWQPSIQRFFRLLDAERWDQSHQNPVLVLNELGDEGLTEALSRAEVAAAFEEALAAHARYYERNPPFIDAHAPLVIGYFSLEFGLAECLPIYSGGLGVLAGDHLKATSDLGLPLVAVGLYYKHGFGRQDIDASGRQVEVYFENRGSELPVRRVEDVEVEAPI